MKKKKSFIFRVDAHTKSMLEQLAEERVMSMSEVIRYLIEKEWQIVTIPKIGSISSKGITIKEEIERA